MAAWPNPYLPLLLIAALLAFEDWLSTPSCSGGSPALHPASGDLRAMLVADLMLLGSDATYADRFFRYHLMSKLITKSIQTTNPDIIIVLGDISAKGSEQSESKWVAVLEQFEGILGQYSSLPIHIVLGDKDVGGCLSLDGKLVHRMANHLPGLDSSGCGAFEISNTSFLSLNAIALLCGDNALRFGVEKVMEMESHRFQRKSGDDGTRLYDRLHTLPANSTQYILQALKPRIIFSAHAHSFSDYTHADGTREVTVPAMTWKKSGVPGFVIATFGQKGTVSVNCCSLAQEWYTMTGYSAFLFLTALAVRWSHWM
ncbi:hypothetical protein ACQ4PT_049245 [Festuca glaucescens]